MTAEELSIKQLEAPSGSFTLKVDGQGRIQVPGEWVTYFEGTLGERDFFVTWEKGWIKIFPKCLWMKQKAAAYAQKSEEEYENWSLAMQHYGWMTTLDQSKKLTPNPALRTELNLKGAELTMMDHQGTLRGKLTSEYEARIQVAKQSAEEQISKPEGARLL